MIGPLNVFLFVVLSAVAVIASLHAWRVRQSYGLFRFLAFESLALLIVWNVRHWFRDPFSFSQIVSWVIIVASTILAIHGLYLLRVVGRARARIMENTQTVVQVGVYRFIRHPLYSSLMFFGWGVFFKSCDYMSAALALVATSFWIATARSEERFNIARFGAAYGEYMGRTKMFIPFTL
jgi:protein-S-isoprenylcysteine O-methyltransferase Ste14